jgi:FkbM family methyltransferase
MTMQIGSFAREFYFRPDSSDMGAILQIFNDGAYDLRKLRRYSELMEFARRSMATGKRPLIVDAGANIGASAVYFSTECPDALVVAIEPEAMNFQLLVENTKDLNVMPLPCAISASPMHVRVVDVGEGTMGYRTEQVSNHASSDQIVSCVTINELCEAHQSDCFPFIAKIDIEGAEKELFSKNTEWVAKMPLIIIELHDWLMVKQRTAIPFLKCIANHDRDFVTLPYPNVSENIFSIANNLADMLAVGYSDGIDGI